MSSARVAAVRKSTSASTPAITAQTAAPRKTVCSVAMSAVLYLPVSDYAKHSIRGASLEGGLDYSYATMWSLHPSEMLTFVVPYSFGFGKELYLGHMSFTDYPNYLGVIVAGFALVAVFAVRGRWVLFLDAAP